MVTENRAPIWGIGLTSFLTQAYSNRHLMVLLPPSQEAAYRSAAAKFDDHRAAGRVLYVCVNDRLTVPERLDLGCQMAFDSGAGLVTVWDDDDWSPDDRLSRTANVPWDDSLPCYCSYAAGWFVNLRTLMGEYIETLPAHLWGGTLTFNNAAWARAKGFAKNPMPGYDRAFQDALKAAPESKQHRIHCGGRGDPIAFSHGKNVATWLKNPGTPMKDYMEVLMPPMVLSEVLRCQQLMIDTRTFPPQPEST